MTILMVPPCVLAVIVATAVPQRLAAEATMDEAAIALASVAVAWRDAQGRDHDRVGWFFPDCAPLDNVLPSIDPPSEAPATATMTIGGPISEARTAELDAASAPESNEGDGSLLDADLSAMCETLTRSLLAGFGDAGFDPATLGGFYSSAYTTATGDHHDSVPCLAASRTAVADAVHLGMSADWPTGWAAAQAWPEPTAISAEAIGRIIQPRTRREHVARDVLAARPGLDWLCLNGPQPAQGAGRFVTDAAVDLTGSGATDVETVRVVAVSVVCETDGATAPVRGLFPTVTFRGHGTHVAVIGASPEPSTATEVSGSDGSPRGSVDDNGKSAEKP